MMVIINKLMWLACVFVSIAFLALSYIVIGKEERWMAIMHQIESSNLRTQRKLARSSKDVVMIRINRVRIRDP
ncbi:hypothetical protein H5410_058934 [Solanum commersonii]|uniref:Uncharacterized protein n=1 Tax=Solanum commersonii TaxID=4109 RepID=A0A9J5W1E4_SOLCO|nr:hypothetical protein H5410_058934 [Solanum commersonii]